jgi:hypothetical protein
MVSGVTSSSTARVATSTQPVWRARRTMSCWRSSANTSLFHPNGCLFDLYPSVRELSRLAGTAGCPMSGSAVSGLTSSAATRNWSGSPHTAPLTGPRGRSPPQDFGRITPWVRPGPSVRPGSRPPRGCRRGGPPGPPGRSPGPPGRTGPRRSWSAAGPHQSQARRCGHGAAQQLTSGGVAALEHGLEPGHGCFALQPEAAGPGAIPPAWTLTVAGQILFVVGGQLAGVVGLPAHREFGDVGHHPPLPSRLRWRQQRTRGALLSSENGLG